MYIMARDCKGDWRQISEDNKKTWLTVEEFRKKHEAILSLTLKKQMNEVWLEIQMMDVVDDPLWEKKPLVEKNILAHGGDISEDLWDYTSKWFYEK